MWTMELDKECIATILNVENVVFAVESACSDTLPLREQAIAAALDRKGGSNDKLIEESIPK